MRVVLLTFVFHIGRIALGVVEQAVETVVQLHRFLFHRVHLIVRQFLVVLLADPANTHIYICIEYADYRRVLLLLWLLFPTHLMNTSCSEVKVTPYSFTPNECLFCSKAFSKSGNNEESSSWYVTSIVVKLLGTELG